LEFLVKKNLLTDHCVTVFDVVLSPRRKANKWVVNIKHATIENLEDFIYDVYQLPELENEVVLNLKNDNKIYHPRNDDSFRKILQLFVSTTKLNFTVFIETPSKPFSEWSFPRVCELYGLSDDPNPGIEAYSVFSCGSADLNSEKSKEVVKHLIAELNLRKKTTPLTFGATKIIYSYCYLASGVSLYEHDFRIVPKKLVEGRNGHGNFDLAIVCRSTGRILAGLVEVKNEDFRQGFAQATMQMESSITCRKRTCRKRKANEMEYEMDKVWGIVTDAEQWYFMECTLDEERNLTFKLSKPVIVVYDDDNMEEKVEKVLSHIVWLLGEAQKPVEVSKRREANKKVKLR
jgi:hypothetical protein